MRLRPLLILLSSLFLLQPAQAAFNPSLFDPDNLNGVLPDDVAREAAKALGIYFAHRPYQGAVSIYDNNALDFGIEVSLIKIGDGVSKALAANDMASSTDSSSVALPNAKIHIRKALSQTLDMGFSGFFYQGQYCYGLDFKIELSNPPEGLNTAIRLGYSYASAPALYLDSVKVISPEFVASRQIEAAETYIGTGIRYITGTIAVPFDVPPADPFTATKSGSGFTAYAFTGVKFQILGPKGFRLGMEGTYDISGFSSLGTFFGIGF